MLDLDTAIYLFGYNEYIEYRTRVHKQVAQLSQRDHATLGVVEYFAKSLKVTGGHLK